MTSKNRLSLIALALIMLTFTVGAGCAPEPIKGTVASPFTITVLDYEGGIASKDNRTVTLASLKEKPIILYFFASW